MLFVIQNCVKSLLKKAEKTEPRKGQSQKLKPLL